MKIISGVYKITNTITGDFYIGSSKNVKRRWAEHKCQSVWNEHPNSLLYKDMKRYGVDKFVLEILEEVEAEKLKETEQQLIETLKPTYNNYNAKGLDIERHKESHRKAQNKYDKSHRESHRKAKNKYDNQFCNYNGETLTLRALYLRFRRQGITNPTAEAKKYLVQ